MRRLLTTAISSALPILGAACGDDRMDALALDRVSTPGEHVAAKVRSDATMPKVVEITTAREVEDRWSNVAVIPVVGAADGLIVEFRAQGPFAATFRDAAGRALRTEAGFFDAVAPRAAVAISGENPVELRLYRATTEPGTTRFEITAARTPPTDAVSPEEERRRLARRWIAIAAKRTEVADLLDGLGMSVREAVAAGKLDDKECERMLYTALTGWLSRRIQPDNLTERTRFVCAAAQFCAPSRMHTGTEPLTVLRDGGGQSRSQAIVARWFLQLLTPEQTPTLLASDDARNGHVVCATETAILDVTAGVIVPVAPRQWTLMTDAERLEVLRKRAWVGPSFVLHDFGRGFVTEGHEGKSAEDVAAELYASVPLITFDPAAVGL